MKTFDWYGCYGGGWRNEIVSEAFSHPAKFARALIRRIYEHAVERGWLAEGDVVLDPFAGVALGGLDAMFHGLHWVGVELEEKFVGLGQQNIDSWNRRYSRMPRWGTATLLRGDSRELVAVLDGARVKACVSSPPYATKTIHGRGGLKLERFKEPGRIGKTSHAIGECEMDDYGTDPANLGNMPTGDVDAVIGSPPYATGQAHPSIGSVNKDDWGHDGRDIAARRGLSADYGQSPGQLAAMPEGAFEAQAMVSSPPWMYTHAGHDTGDTFEQIGGVGHQGLDYCDESPKESTMGGDRTSPEAKVKRRIRAESIKNLSHIVVEGNRDNLVNTDTFWAAARQIVQQCHQVLAPGGVAIFVLKSFVRNKQIVNFPDQWRQMCEACGFETLEWIRAWLVEDRGAQYDLEGSLIKREVRRESFFRRLHRQKYPDLSIDYEIVLVMRRVDYEHQ